MLNNNIIILDIETLPNKELIEKSICRKMGFSTYEEYVEFENQHVKPGKTFFPKPIFHKIINIGLFYISQNLNYKYKNFFANTEEELLYDYWVGFGKCKLPTIVSYNGILFDMPIISMMTGKYMMNYKDEFCLSTIERYHSKDDTWEKYGPNYLNRFSKYHIDLSKNMGYPIPSLIEACSLYNIPAKTEAFGNDVVNMNMEDIRKYCKEDVMATAKLWTHHMLMHSIDFANQDFYDINSLIDNEIAEEDNF